jgi:hypothetical protein
MCPRVVARPPCHIHPTTLPSPLIMQHLIATPYQCNSYLNAKTHHRNQISHEQLNLSSHSLFQIPTPKNTAKSHAPKVHRASAFFTIPLGSFLLQRWNGGIFGTGLGDPFCCWKESVFRRIRILYWYGHGHDLDCEWMMEMIRYACSRVKNGVRRCKGFERA